MYKKRFSYKANGEISGRRITKETISINANKINNGYETPILMIFTLLLLSYTSEVLAEEMISVRLRIYFGNTSNLSFRIKGG